MLRRLLNKLRWRKVSQQDSQQEFPNRFLKFYYLNKKKLIAERKQAYYQKKQAGICVRCRQPALPRIIFCSYHQERQKEYNLKARLQNPAKKT